jgi:alpha-L-rhamnosidase
MTSFNHFAFGAVGEWIYKVILGISPDENLPGYKHILIKPQPGGTLTWVKGHYDSIRGRIEVHWKLEADAFILEVSIPANTSATIYVPATNVETITESGKELKMSEEIQLVKYENNIVQIEIKSGKYLFKSELAPKLK